MCHWLFMALMGALRNAWAPLASCTARLACAIRPSESTYSAELSSEYVSASSLAYARTMPNWLLAMSGK